MLLTRSRWVFTTVALILTAVVVIVTPRVWNIEWAGSPALLGGRVPHARTTGSLFPLFPWSAYVLLGIALGQLYGRWGAANMPSFANASLLLPGLLLIAGGLALRPLAERLFGAPSWSFVPPEVFVRAGTRLRFVGVMAHGSRYIARLPRVFSAVAQETLLIYFVHLCLVYGSVWSPGLFQLYGATLSPPQVLAVVIVLLAAMAALAWQWNWLKHTSPRGARWVTIGVGTLLVARLL